MLQRAEFLSFISIKELSQLTYDVKTNCFHFAEIDINHKERYTNVKT
jgi:hypothetical protein